jgi:hypothetical protein
MYLIIDNVHDEPYCVCSTEDEANENCYHFLKEYFDTEEEAKEEFANMFDEDYCEGTILSIKEVPDFSTCFSPIEKPRIRFKAEDDDFNEAIYLTPYEAVKWCVDDCHSAPATSEEVLELHLSLIQEMEQFMLEHKKDMEANPFRFDGVRVAGSDEWGYTIRISVFD